MPELGGLNEMPDIKALILYLLKEANCVLKESQLTDVLMADGLVEYFAYAEATEQLLMAGLMDIASLEETGSYRITKKGLEVVGEYVQRLSFAFDVKCFFGTVVSVLKHDGVVEGGTGELEKKKEEADEQ